MKLTTIKGQQLRDHEWVAVDVTLVVDEEAGEVVLEISSEDHLQHFRWSLEQHRKLMEANGAKH